MIKIFINDDVKAFEKAFSQELQESNIYFDKYCLLSCLYLFNCKKILRKYEKLLIKNFNKQVKDYGYNLQIDREFCKLAKLNVKFYIPDNTPNPIDILLLKKEFKKAIKLQKLLGTNNLDIKMIKQLIEYNELNKVVVQNEIIKKAPLTKKQKIARIIACVCCFIAVLIPSIIIGNYVHIQSGLIYSYNDNYGGYILSCGKYYNPTKLDIPNEYRGKQVVGIENKSFNHKSNLQQVCIGSNIKLIKEGTFLGCNNLEVVNVIDNSNLTQDNLNFAINKEVELHFKYYLSLYDNVNLLRTIEVEFGQNYNCGQPIKAGYTFNGWFDEFDNPFTDSAGCSNSVYTTYNSTNLYTNYSANTNKVIFNGNGATSGSMPTQLLKTGQTANLEKNTFEKTGYSFVGWSTTQNSSVLYEDQNSYTMGSNSSYTLYAVWKANTNTIIFNGNGATSGEMANQSAKTDQVVTLNKNQYQKDGYTFVGWSTSPKGQIEYIDCDKTYQMGTVLSYTLYAVWKANLNTIIFDGNGATSGEMTNQYASSNSNVKLNKNEFSKQGYHFIGWANNKNGNSQYADCANYLMGINSQNILYAVWEPNTNIITFNGNGSTSGSMSSQSGLSNSNISLNQNMFKRVGFSFAGWSTSPNGEIEYLDCSKFSLGVESNYTLYAIWNANTNTIIFNGNGATSGEMANQSAKTDQVVTLNKNQYQKDGYTFVGWSTSPKGQIEYIDCDKTYQMGTSSSYTLYAIWEFGALYFVYNEQNLIDLIASNYNDYDEIRLMADLDFKGSEITPFANFTTKFNGNHFSISNFKINNRLGFFERTSGAIIRNLGLCNTTLTSTSYDAFGGLIGKCADTTVEECYTTGRIYINRYTGTTEDTRATAGGLIGEFDSYTNSTVKNCYSTCDVTARANYIAEAGGLIGGFTAGSAVVITIENCYATGNITTYSYGQIQDSRAYSGGFIGDVNKYSSGSSATINISNCFATGNLESYANRYNNNGGFAESISNVESNISNCYSYSGQKSTNNGRESFINYNYSKTVELSEIYSFVFNNWDTDTWNLSLTESPTLK